MGLKLRRCAVGLGLFALVGGALAACGDDDDSGSSATTGAATATTAASATTAAGATTAAPATTASPATTSGSGAATTASGATTTPSSGSTSFTSLDALYEAAKKEPKLVVYASLSPDPLQKVTQEFEAKYPGVDVEAVRGIDGDLAPKVETEHDTGKVNASLYVSASKSWVDDHAQKGWFLPVDGPELTGNGTYDASQYVHPGNDFEVGAAVLTFAWNSDLFKAGIKDYPDLLNPELKGKIGVPEPSSPSIVDFYLWMEETYGEDFVAKLAAQEPQIYASAVAIGEALSSGEIAATPYAAPSTLAPLKEKGAPVDFGISDKGAWGARYFGMVMQDSPSPNAAQLYSNYLVTPEGQQTLFINAGSVQPDVPGTLLTNEQVRKQDLSKLTADKVAAYQQKWNGLFR